MRVNRLTIQIAVDTVSSSLIPRQVKWMGNSRKSIRDFPRDLRREVGYQLERMQAGKAPTCWKPATSGDLGVKEIRVREGDAFRVIYVAELLDTVCVLHAI